MSSFFFELPLFLLLYLLFECHDTSKFTLNYSHLRYVSILVELTRLEGTRHGKLIAGQMLDVAIRVQSIRPFAVSQMALLLENAHLIVANVTNVGRHGMSEVSYITFASISLHYFITFAVGRRVKFFMAAAYTTLSLS